MAGNCFGTGESNWLECAHSPCSKVVDAIGSVRKAIIVLYNNTGGAAINKCQSFCSNVSS